MGSPRSDIHDRVLNAASLDEIEQAYSEWAKDYDSDLVDLAGYVAPAICADALLEYLPDKSVSVLDAGCGTGLVGERLAEGGVALIDGLDYSADMLNMAAAKGCYAQLLRADLNSHLDIPSDHYHASICVGTFTSGHVKPHALHELLRVTRPGGPVCFTVRDSFWDASNFGATLAELEETGSAMILSQSVVPYITSEGSESQRVILQRC